MRKRQPKRSRTNRLDTRMNKYLTYEYKTKDELEDAIVELKEVRDVIMAAADHYSDKEKLNDWREVWYSNAREHYQNSAFKVGQTIMQLMAKNIPDGVR